MKAIILAGGKGTRLTPYTTILPKPLMPIGNMPILEVVIRQLKGYGFAEVTLAVGYLAELIMAYFDDGSRYEIKINYSKEEKPLGTAGPLALIPELSSTFLVMNGDVLTTLDYVELVRYHQAQGAVATIAMHKRSVNIDLGVMKTNSQNELIEYIEKPTLHYHVSMGIYIFEPKVLDYIKPGESLDFPELVRILLANGERVLAYPYDGYWLDIGRQDDYEKAIEDFGRMQDKLLPSSS